MTFDNGGAASETESEDDTSETEKECIKQISSVKLTLSSFKNYLLWTTKHTVKRELIKSGFIENDQDALPLKQELVLEDLISTVKSSVKQESPKAVSPASSSDSSGEAYNTSDLLGRTKQTGDLGKRRIQPAHFISTADIIKTLKENKAQVNPVQEVKSKVSPVKMEFKEQVVVFENDDDMSDGDDPRTGTQLVNNESLAQCSQDSETNLAAYSVSSALTIKQQEVGQKRTHLSREELKGINISEIWRTRARLQ